MSDSPFSVDFDDRSRLWLGLMRFSLIVPRRLEHELQAEAGLTFASFGILANFLRPDAGPRRIGDLAARTGLSFSRASRAVAALERDGLVERQPADGDGRGSQVCVTEAGREVLKAVIPQQARLAGELILDRLDPAETARLADLFGDVADRAEPTSRVYTDISAPGVRVADPVESERAEALSADLFDDLVRVQVGLWSAVESRVRAELGVPLSWYGTLRVLAGGVARASSVARVLGITEAGAGKLLARIEEAGHLTRREDPSDARATLVEVTEPGVALLRGATDIVESEMAGRIGQALTADEIEQLGMLLQKVRRAQGN
jgi:DNA-binding MarR family transcriptional regulator